MTNNTSKHSFASFLQLPIETQISTIGSAIGYGAITAVVPVTLTSDIFTSMEASALVAQGGGDWAYLSVLTCPIAFLLVSVITGGLLTAFSQFFINTRRLMATYLLALTLAAATLFSLPTRYVTLALLGTSYSLFRFLWKIHILNKDMNAYAVSFAPLFCGLFLFSGAFLIDSALTILPSLLLIISGGFFALAIANTCADWVIVPQAALSKSNLSLGRKLMPSAANALCGVTFGVFLAYAQQEERFLLIGSAWIAISLGLIGLLFSGKSLKKNTVRACFLLVDIGFLLSLLLGYQNETICLISSFIIMLASLFSTTHITLSHCDVEKDDTLCDVHLSALRVFTNPVGIIVGAVASYSMLAGTTALESMGLTIMIFITVATVAITLVSMKIIGPGKAAQNAPKQRVNSMEALSPQVHEIIEINQESNTLPLEEPNSPNANSKEEEIDSNVDITCQDTEPSDEPAETVSRIKDTPRFFDAPEDPKPAVDEWHEKAQLVAKINGLTPRQVDIFEALSRGRNAKYIMQRLYLSEGAVKKQMYTIYKKLGVHRQQDLITMVMDSNIDVLKRKAAEQERIKNHK